MVPCTYFNLCYFLDKRREDKEITLCRLMESFPRIYSALDFYVNIISTSYISRALPHLRFLSAYVYGIFSATPSVRDPTMQAFRNV
jgi:hypothetical protein